MKVVFNFVLLLFCLNAHGQNNKAGNRWISGAAKGVEAIFNDTIRPSIKVVYGAAPHYYVSGHSNISDSATGKLLFSCNGMVVYDSTGAIMDNGDSLVESKIYTHNAFPLSGYTQGSLILPKGSNGFFYVFLTTITDSAYNYYITTNEFPFDRLQYSVVDMNANNGLGKVIVKSKPILQGVAIHKTMMQACRHSNGIDWWLLKQGEYDTNRIYRFLVRSDTVLGPYIQNFDQPKYPFYDVTGQYAFSQDGTKFASLQGKGKMNKLFIADFDRCTGELNNPVVINIPIDSTGYSVFDNNGLKDSVNTGVSFSPNGQFIYISKQFNIYQYEHQQIDSMLAWYRVQHGADTAFQQFQEYSHLYRGIDNRIYIGNVGGQAKQTSVIDKPDIKGFGCQFCRKCFRLDTSAIYGMTSPPNMPDYNLGASGVTCWPLNNSEFSILNDELEVYPNPASTVLYIRTSKKAKIKIELFNSVGQLLYSTFENEIDVSRYSKGVYYIKAGSAVKKVVIE